MGSSSRSLSVGWGTRMSTLSLISVTGRPLAASRKAALLRSYVPSSGAWLWPGSIGSYEVSNCTGRPSPRKM